jgi:hypothetical protein
MRKNVIIATVVVVLLLSAGIASARGRWGFGVLINPPVYVSPAPVPPSVYQSYPDYDRSAYAYDEYREWVPGHWEQRPGQFGWRSVWIPGHWSFVR